MSRVVRCQARPDYMLWLQYDDGLDGAVYVGNLLELGAFAIWRNRAVWMRVHPGEDGTSIVWPDGIRLDAGILWNYLAAVEKDETPGRGRRSAKKVAPRPDADVEFQRFMEVASTGYDGPLGSVRSKLRAALRSEAGKRVWLKRRQKQAGAINVRRRPRER